MLRRRSPPYLPVLVCDRLQRIASHLALKIIADYLRRRGFLSPKAGVTRSRARLRRQREE
ncbi:MAG: hypothetical protein V2A73_20905 [Pseudomonadota bacterium]